MKQKSHLGVIHDAILATYVAKTASLFFSRAEEVSS